MHQVGSLLRKKTFLVLPYPKMLALRSFDTSIITDESTRRKTPEESNLQVIFNFVVKEFATKLNASSADETECVFGSQS